MLKIYDNLEKYKNGEKIYGDDFTIDQIEEWFRDESEAYCEIVPEQHRDTYDEYKLQTEVLLYRYINKNSLSLLSYGGGYGTEIIPIIDKVKEVTILEPGSKFVRDEIKGKKVKYIVPEPSGKMHFRNGEFDCITCLGVLHHIPNVTYIISEFSRVLKDDGIILIREPISSMNLFSGQRNGLTPHERGLPLNKFKQIICDNGLTIKKQTLYDFGPLWKIKSLLKIKENKFYLCIDILLSKLFLWNYSYDSKNYFKKFRPNSVAFVLCKKKYNK